MQRVVVIGCSGSGKSTLARELGRQTGLPVHHMDQLYWQPGWKDHPHPEQLRDQVQAIVAGSRWIIEGGFTSVTGPGRFERADIAVLFDLPTSLCLYRAFKRYLTYRGETRPDLAPGCPETFDLAFYRYILTYRWAKLPQVEALLARHATGRVVRIRNERDRARLLAEAKRV